MEPLVLGPKEVCSTDVEELKRIALDMAIWNHACYKILTAWGAWIANPTARATSLINHKASVMGWLLKSLR